MEGREFQILGNSIGWFIETLLASTDSRTFLFCKLPSSTLLEWLPPVVPLEPAGGVQPGDPQIIYYLLSDVLVHYLRKWLHLCGCIRMQDVLLGSQ